MSLKSQLFTWSFSWIHEHQICMCHSRERLKTVDKCFLKKSLVQSVQFSHSVRPDSLWPHGLQHTRLPSPLPNSWSLFKLMFIKSEMLYNHLILCHPLLLLPSSFPSTGSFPMSQFITSGGQSIGASISASALPMNIQDWFPLGLTGWISLQFRGLKRLLQHHSSEVSILWHSAFFIAQLSHPYMTTGKTIALTRRTFVGKIMSMLFNMLS